VDLIGLELQILALAEARASSIQPELHGYLIATSLSPGGGARLASEGRIYRALARLEDAGYLKSRWEVLGPDQSGPRKRLYRLTGKGQTELDHARAVLTASHRTAPVLP
jgi:PadR family transcriptional regulator, regulatory protein PadR